MEKIGVGSREKKLETERSMNLLILRDRTKNHCNLTLVVT